MYIQASVDGGVTWHDIVHFPQLAAGAAAVSYSLAISDYAQSSAPVVVGTGLAPALAANTVVGGSFGDRLRVVFKAGAGTTAGAAQVVTASFTT